MPLAEHWNGTSWSVTATKIPTGRDRGLLQDIVAISPKDVWAVGSSISTSDGSNRTLAEHWNGKKWKIFPTAEPAGVSSSYLQSVTAISTDDVWAVGYFYDSADGGSIIEHWDGKTWTLVTDADPFSFHPSLQSVTATSSKDVWATGFYFDSVGAGVTLVEHWNGKKWKLVASPNAPDSADTELHAISATSAKDAWATGFFFNGSAYQPLTEHWDGSDWTIVDAVVPSGSTNTYLYGVETVSAKDMWATGYYFASGSYRTLAEHWNGKKWKVVPTPNTAGSNSNYLFGVSSVSKNDVWASGFSFTDGDIAVAEHWDGSAWTIVPVA